MNINDPLYNRFHLVREIYETIDYIKNFSAESAGNFLPDLQGKALMLTGEGSSRIFPGKNAVHRRLKSNGGALILTESSTDLSDKNLEDFIVIGASNSGKTKELINLFRNLENSGHKYLYGLTCNRNSLLEKYCVRTRVIDAGPEKAVAASKSVVAQALFYDAIISGWDEKADFNTSLLARNFEEALNSPVSNSITDLICRADTVYFSGYNNGAAEELTLKTNEIIRKKSSYLPGTYLLHGVEEVMSPKDIIIMVDTYPEEFDKIKSVYSDNIGTPVISISSSSTPFHTVKTPHVSETYKSYIKLAAGWNMLIEAGIKLGIDPDKPERARKIGNEAAD